MCQQNTVLTIQQWKISVLLFFFNINIIFILYIKGSTGLFFLSKYDEDCTDILFYFSHCFKK